MADRLARPLRDLRVSVTDRCNLRCRYCLPREVYPATHPFLPASELLSFDEVERAVRAFAALGVRKVRLTGGEPLLRPGLADLVRRLAGVPGIEDLALTTNGTALAAAAPALRDAGLSRVSVSLDSLDPAVFAAVAGTRLPVAAVLAGIAAADAAGLRPVKVNCVVRRGLTDGAGLLAVAGYARDHGYTARFIEYMDVGTTNGWRPADVVPGAEVLDLIGSRWPVEPVPRDDPAEVATRYRYRDGAGEVGVITSVSAPFCGGCTRARLTATGVVHTCLFSGLGHDLRPLLADGVPGADREAFLRRLWSARDDRYSQERAGRPAAGGAPGPPRPEMAAIGG